MSLPTIKVPKFTLTLPVSGIEVKARPFLIREQKMLLQAMEIGDKTQVVLALDDIMNDCTFDELDIDNLSVPDVEYLMLHLRSKSVGEEIKMSYTCSNTVQDDNDQPTTCDTKIKVSININDVNVKSVSDHKYKLIFDDNIGMVLQDIPYGIYKYISTDKDSLERTMTLRNSCVKSIFDADRVWTRNEFTDEELDDFVEGLYSNDYEQIEDFIDNMPILEHTIELKCPSCGHKEKITLRGLDDFLG